MTTIVVFSDIEIHTHTKLYQMQIDEDLDTELKPVYSYHLRGRKLMESPCERNFGVDTVASL